MHDVRFVAEEREVLHAFSVMQELRPHLSEKTYLQLYQDMKKSGYTLIGLYVDGEIVALGGVAIMTNFYSLKHVYVYDLITAAKHRSKGYGKTLLSYIEQWGKDQGCTSVELTSGFQRIDAHRFYEREGYIKKSYSFGKGL
ncbi:GNAT family N-acetyltransferase [Ectobacillus sp. JY-23]|uniref:GNAT family N-acetyltransferase n=1 Tax=Ectobacillus sp. JY-23 TaxID=2933872 RepID=UPI001FF32939|nr:GNAT family N-acetyltransferase [Ectobacillus sp. JY-23]UOY94407.1 GNAT family N-acetyltransferase [Ectobacillus sp. JY-23]